MSRGALTDTLYRQLDEFERRLKVLERAIGRPTTITRVAIDAPGPLPITGAFEATGGRCWAIVSSTAYSTAVGLGNLAVSLDGSPLELVEFTFRTVDVRYALPMRAIDLGSIAGEATIGLTAGPAPIATNSSDRYQVIVIETIP